MQWSEPVHISRGHLTARRLQQLADQIRHAVLRSQVQRCVALLILIFGTVQDLGHNIMVPIVSCQLCCRQAICILQARHSGAAWCQCQGSLGTAKCCLPGIWRQTTQLHDPCSLTEWAQRHLPEGASSACRLAAGCCMQSWHTCSVRAADWRSSSEWRLQQLG